MYPIVLLIYAVCLLILEIVAIASEILQRKPQLSIYGDKPSDCGGYKHVLYAHAQIFVLRLVHYELGLCLMEDS